MSEIVVVTTSYPEHADDAQGHFVAAEVRRLCADASTRVTVLAPGHARRPLAREHVVSLGGASAFGFPGALARLRQAPWRAAAAAEFVARAMIWLGRHPPPRRLIAHFLLPCGIPIATRAIPIAKAKHRIDQADQPSTIRGQAIATQGLEIVAHGSDARLFAQLAGRSPRVAAWLGAELARSGAELRFVSNELRELVLATLPPASRDLLAPRSRVEPCAIDVTDVPTRAHARAQLGLEPYAPVAVIVARLVPAKRVDVALSACRRVPGLRAVVIGDGPARPELARRFPEARFVGHVPRPLALTYLAAADALVSASLHEGAPSIVREARALGTPVVCLPAGDLEQWARTDPGIHVVTP